MDYKYNRHYFDSINWIFVAGLSIFTIVFLYLYIWIGIVSLLGLGAYIYFKLWNKPKDEEIDAACVEQAQIIFQKGYEKLGIQADDVKQMDPVMFHGPLLKQISYDPAVKHGKDREVRSSNQEISVFYFSEHQVYVYDHCYSLIDDEQNERMNEYFYNDIVSLSSETTTKMYYNEGRKRDDFLTLHTITFTIVDGTKETFSVKDIQVEQSKIDQIKRLIRVKKGA